MNMEAVKSSPFKGISMLTVLPIISSQPKELVRVLLSNGHDHRKIQWVEMALAEDKAEFMALFTFYVEFPVRYALFLGVPESLADNFSAGTSVQLIIR